jgi:hypothetical protein
MRIVPISEAKNLKRGHKVSLRSPRTAGLAMNVADAPRHVAPRMVVRAMTAAPPLAARGLSGAAPA